MGLEARKIRLLMHLRRSGVQDHRVLGAIERIPRELFVPDAFQDQAYEDIALPIGRGQTISQPLVVAKMTQALEVTDRHKVLEIGTGSGYQAAILAKLCRRLYTVERHKFLLDIAMRRFESMRLHNITARAGDGLFGWREQAPFDRIIVTAGSRSGEPPPTLAAQLAIGGVMIIPLGDERDDQALYRLTKTEDGWDGDELWPVRFVPLLPDVAEDERPARTA